MGRFTGYWIDGDRICGPGESASQYYIEEGCIRGPGTSGKCRLRVDISPAGHRVSYIYGPNKRQTPFYVFHYRVYGPDNKVPWLHEG